MKTLQIKLSDEVYDQINRTKARTGMTWPAFLVAATKAYEREERCKDDGR